MLGYKCATQTEQEMGSSVFTVKKKTQNRVTGKVHFSLCVRNFLKITSFSTPQVHLIID